MDSPHGKRKLAAALEQHDPAFLGDLKMLAGALGKMAAVGYRPDDIEREKRVLAHMLGEPTER